MRRLESLGFHMQKHFSIAVAILFRTFLWTRGARPQKCPRPNRSGGCYIKQRSVICQRSIELV
jgi:hypothetical protein